MVLPREDLAICDPTTTESTHPQGAHSKDAHAQGEHYKIWLLEVKNPTPVFARLANLQFGQVCTTEHDINKLSYRHIFANYEGDEMIFIELKNDGRPNCGTIAGWCGYKYTRDPLYESSDTTTVDPDTTASANSATTAATANSTAVLKLHSKGLASLNLNVDKFTQDNVNLRAEVAELKNNLSSMHAHFQLYHIQFTLVSALSNISHLMYTDYTAKMIYVVIEREIHEAPAIRNALYYLYSRLDGFTNHVTFVGSFDVESRRYAIAHGRKYALEQCLYDTHNLRAYSSIVCTIGGMVTLPLNYSQSLDMFTDNTKFDASTCEIVIIESVMFLPSLEDLKRWKIKQVIVAYSKRSNGDAPYLYRVLSLITRVEFLHYKNSLNSAGIDLIWCFNRFAEQ